MLQSLMKHFQIMEQSGKAIAMDHQSDDEDADDEEIRPTDTLVAVAMSEDEHSHLEIQLLTEDGDLYTHHDIALPDFPLCLAWLDCPPYLSKGQQQSTGNYMGKHCTYCTFDELELILSSGGDL